MPGYMVYWPQDRVKELEKAGDIGPIKVVLGSVHSRMPSIASVKVGDVVFPVTLVKKQLCVLARLPVEHREPAFDYCIRELGEEHGALIPEGVAPSVTTVRRTCRRGSGLFPFRSRWQSPT